MKEILLVVQIIFYQDAAAEDLNVTPPCSEASLLFRGDVYYYRYAFASVDDQVDGSEGLAQFSLLEVV